MRFWPHFMRIMAVTIIQRSHSSHKNWCFISNQGLKQDKVIASQQNGSEDLLNISLRPSFILNEVVLIKADQAITVS